MTLTHPGIDWALARLTELGWTPTGGPEVVKDRSWSLVVRLATDHGPAWLKVNRGATTYEPAVLALLATVAPGLVLHPLAVDLDRGWSLNPDGGPTLRSTWSDTGPDAEVLGRVLHEYADLQRATAAHTSELLGSGVPDLRPQALAATLEDLLEDADWSLLETGEDADPGARERVMAHRETVAAQCDELEQLSATLGIPVTLQHDDLHDNNVFVTASGDGSPTYRVFDWGDSCVSHPFSTLLVALRSFAAASEQPVDSPVVQQLREAYLDAWADIGPRAELERVADLAIALGPINRAHSWRNALTEAKPDELTQFADAVPGWLAELVPPTPS